MFSVQDHLHEHFCTFEQLVGKTQIEIESAVAKQTKNVQFCFLFLSKHFASDIFYHCQRDILKQILTLVLE